MQNINEIKSIKRPKATARKVNIWDKIKMYFGWGEYAYLPQNFELASVDEFPEESIFCKESQPYIITIENTGKKEEEVEIFGAYKNLTEDNYGNKKCIQLTSLTPNVTYVEVVSELSNKPVEIGKVYLKSCSANQVTMPFKLTAKDANGNLISKTVVPYLDPYQQQSTVTDNNVSFVIDGNLNIKTKMLPGEKLHFYLWPSSRGKQISSFDSLANLIGYERKK